MTKKKGAKSSAQKRVAVIAAHIFLVLIIFILPELVMAMAFPGKGWFADFRSGFIFKTILYLAVFYTNYFFIVDKTLGREDGKRHVVKFIIYDLLLIAIGVVACIIWGHLVNSNNGGRHFHHYNTEEIRWVFRWASFVLRDVVMMILSIGAAVALRLSVRWQIIENRHKEILTEQRSTELDNLKSQLNPHFLFNVLNGIYSLIDIDSKAAQQTIHDLSGMLRYMLYEDSPEVALKNEVEFIDNYVALMRLRTSRKVDFKVNIDDAPTAVIPPLLFIPMVENVFKHSNESVLNDNIEITITANSEHIIFTSKNPFNKERHQNSSDSGIGLRNLSRRLDLIYGPEAMLTLSQNDEIFTTTLSIPTQIPEHQ